MTHEYYWPLSLLAGFILLTLRINQQSIIDYFSSLSNQTSKQYNFTSSLFNFILIIAPSIIYFLLLLTWNFRCFFLENLKAILTIIILSTSAYAAILALQNNIEFRYLESLTGKYHKLFSYFEQEKLNKSSLDQIVITIKSVKRLKSLISKRYLQELAILEEESVRAFVGEKVASSSLEYFTSFTTPETEEKAVDRLSDKRSTPQDLIIEDDGRALRAQLSKAMKEHDQHHTDDIERDKFAFKIEHEDKWQFKSGLNLEHIFVMLSFIDNRPLNYFNERMRKEKRDRLMRSVIRKYPRLLACLYYLWFDKHDNGRTFPEQLEKELM